MNERIIADIISVRPGPTTICTAAIHGNEPSGILAARRVAEKLNSSSRFSGRFIALIGNLTALSQDKRFIDEDLNRLWSTTTNNNKSTSESEQKRQLIANIDRVLAESSEVFFIDLHSTSSESPPFIAFCSEVSTERTRNILDKLKLPRLVAADSELQGLLAQYMSSRAVFSLAVEGGSHYTPETVKANEAILSLFLQGNGQLEIATEGTPWESDYLSSKINGLPKNFGITYAEKICSDDLFCMNPGFKNLQLVKKGELLAGNKQGPIFAPKDGYLLFPLYQPQGSEGFFIAEELPSPDGIEH